MKPEQQAIYSSTVANGPTNKHAYGRDQPERAASCDLSGEPQRIARINEDWWVAISPRCSSASRIAALRLSLMSSG